MTYAQKLAKLAEDKKARVVVKHVPGSGKARAESGIIAPQLVLVPEGSYLYRFASHTMALGAQAGAWWISKEDFDAIVQRASRSGTDLGKKARRDLVVLQKWGSLMDVVVEARVSSRLTAWTGLAKPQQEETPNGDISRLCGNRAIKQLYLWDVVDGSGILTARGREALAITGTKSIVSSPLY